MTTIEITEPRFNKANRSLRATRTVAQTESGKNVQLELSVVHWPERKQYTVNVLRQTSDGVIVSFRTGDSKNMGVIPADRYSQKRLHSIYDDHASLLDVPSLIEWAEEIADRA